MTQKLPPAARILVVDDFEPWRHTVRSILKCHAELQLVGEAANGVEAVKQASELHPDLILLDIGLPHLNGIEAAKQIHQILPTATILFVTMHKGKELVQAALGNGAIGFVLKTDAEKELWPAIQAVLQSKQFVSSGVGLNRN
jgi:DNA-binding NarL/FixJ family response regulator